MVNIKSIIIGKSVTGLWIEIHIIEIIRFIGNTYPELRRRTPESRRLSIRLLFWS